MQLRNDAEGHDVLICMLQALCKPGSHMRFPGRKEESRTKVEVRLTIATDPRPPTVVGMFGPCRPKVRGVSDRKIPENQGARASVLCC